MKRKSPTGSKYPDNWHEIAKAVKEAAGYKCVRCGREHNPGIGYTLTVHHLDIDPENCAWWNIPALCQRCHLHIQGKVVMEQFYAMEHSTWFKPYLAGYYSVIKGWVSTTDYFESLRLFPIDEAVNNFDFLLIAVRDGLTPIRGTGHYEEVW